jgi:hypothetical protein
MARVVLERPLVLELVHLLRASEQYHRGRDAQVAARAFRPLDSGFMAPITRETARLREELEQRLAEEPSL